MLRSHIRTQGSFYVCASCRRQQWQNLAQLPSQARNRVIQVPATSRLLYTTPLSVSKRPRPERPRDAAAQPDNDDASLHPTTTVRIDARAYATWGKFGSNLVPAQSNSAWGSLAPRTGQTPGATSPTSAWGGGDNATKIPPVKPTPVWGDKTVGIPSAKPTSASSNSSANGSSILPAQPTTPAGSNLGYANVTPNQSTVAWASDFKSSGSTVSQFRPPSQFKPPPGIPPRNPIGTRPVSMQGGGLLPHEKLAIQGAQKATPPPPPPPPPGIPPRNPIATRPVSMPDGGLLPHEKLAIQGAQKATPLSPPPPPPGIPLRNPIGTRPVSMQGGRLLPHELLAIQGAQKVTPPPPPPPPPGIPLRNPIGTRPVSMQGGGLLPHELLAIQGAQKVTPPPPSPTPELRPTAQKAESNEQYPSKSSGTATYRKFADPSPPPVPPGAEFPQLRRKWPHVDEFEAQSPFSLPSKNNGLKRDSDLPPTSHKFTPYPNQQSGKAPPAIHMPDRFQDWGRTSGFGSVAPPDPVEAVSSSKTSQTQSRLQRVTTSEPNGARPQPYRQFNGNPSQLLTQDDSSVPSDSAKAWSLMEQAAAVQKDKLGEPLGESDWGISDRELAVPGTAPGRARPAQDTQQNPPGGIENRRKGRDADRDVDRRGRDKDLDRPEKSKKKSHIRRRGHHDDDDDYDDYDNDFDTVDYMEIKKERRRRNEEKRAAQEAAAPKTILLPEYITVHDLAEALNVRPQQFLADLEQLGFENILHDSIMTGDTAALVAAEYGFDPTVETGALVDVQPRPPPEDPLTLPLRPPIVTIMGHVDHGKTTMLDWLRKSSVAAQEHGGITQHIGAFSVRLRSGKTITFLDTPGHAAFLSMRQRGANVTDIVVLVVAVDDSVKSQTIEALKHAQNAKVPIIVAINKIDRDPSGIDKVKQDLASNGVELEDFGGDVQVVAVSGKTGQGMDDLEESILTLSEILDMRAEQDGMAEGWILEASVKVDGLSATVLITRGTLRVGDLIVAGTTYARVRVLRNGAGVKVEEAGPGTPVEVLGWRGPPVAGDMVLQAPDENRARQAVDYREEIADREKAAAQKSDEELKDRQKAEREALEKMMTEEGEEAPEEPTEPSTKTVNIIVRGDVMGSVEAVCTSIMEIGNNEVRPRILRSSPGEITESDVEYAATAKGCIINFNNAISGFIKRKADDQGVRILDHTIIYHLVDDVKAMLSEQLTPLLSQRVSAEAEVLQVFAINTARRNYKNIAGVRVRTGTVTRGGLYRLMRAGEKIHDGKLDTLKQGKKAVSEVRKGTECGMSFDGFDDFQPGDIIQLYEVIQEKRYL